MLVDDEIVRIVERHRLMERLAQVYDLAVLNLHLQIGDRRVALDSRYPLRPSQGDVPVVNAPIHVHDHICGQIVACGTRPEARQAVGLIAIWIEDLLALEHEVASLTYEVVHSYEELHLLYELGGRLGGVLDVAAAGALVVEAVLEPLGALRATVSLVHQGAERMVAAMSSTEVLGIESNGAARASSTLQVNGESIGSIVIEGKRDAQEFSSRDLKLLAGVAAVSAPALWNAQLYEAARRQADTDSLTGVYNHRHVQEQLDDHLDWSRRYGLPLSVMIVEVDDLQLFHDLYGHHVANVVLKVVGDCLRTAARSADVVGSYSDEKFIVVLPESEAAGAMALARRVLAAIRLREIEVEDTHLSVGLSIGVASFPEHSIAKHDLIASAATALHEASASGGGTVRCAGLGEHETSLDDARIDSESFSVLQGLVRAVDAKDHYTQEHSEVVTDAAVLLAQCLELPSEMVEALRIAGSLHDIGKIGIPDYVLKKPGKLTPDEFKIMRQHVVLSEMIVRGVPQPPGVLDAVAYHHERYDGMGYPYGKRGEEIPLLGRIMGIADAYSAMCVDRPYRKALSWPLVRSEIERGAGSQFDPALTHVFVRALDQMHHREHVVPAIAQMP